MADRRELRDAIRRHTGGMRASTAGFGGRPIPQRDLSYTQIVTVQNCSQNQENWSAWTPISVCGLLNSADAADIPDKGCMPTLKACRFNDYSVDYGVGRILGVTQEPIPYGKTGRVCIRGVTIAKTVDYTGAVFGSSGVSRQADWVYLVYASNSNVWSLRPGRSGDARLLKWWVDSSQPSNNTYALIDLCNVTNKIDVMVGANTAPRACRGICKTTPDGIVQAFYWTVDGTSLAHLDEFGEGGEYKIVFSPDWTVPAMYYAPFYLATTDVPVIGRYTSSYQYAEVCCGPCPVYGGKDDIWPGMPGLSGEGRLEGQPQLNNEYLGWFRYSPNSPFSVYFPSGVTGWVHGVALGMDGNICFGTYGSSPTVYDGSGVFPNVSVSVLFDVTLGRGSSVNSGAVRTPNVQTGGVVRCRILYGSPISAIYADDPRVWDDPPGTIKMFTTTSSADIPHGWALCDGTNGTVDLRGKFVLGIDTQSGARSDENTIGAAGGYRFHGNSQNQHTKTNVAAGTGTSTAIGNIDAASGNDTDNRPPYYVLAYIQRVS